MKLSKTQTIFACASAPEVGVCQCVSNPLNFSSLIFLFIIVHTLHYFSLKLNHRVSKSLILHWKNKKFKPCYYINRVGGEKIVALSKLHASHFVKGVPSPKRMTTQGSCTQCISLSHSHPCSHMSSPCSHQHSMASKDS